MKFYVEENCFRVFTILKDGCVCNFDILKDYIYNVSYSIYFFGQVCFI
jgi:hypothetical protein